MRLISRRDALALPLVSFLSGKLPGRVQAHAAQPNDTEWRHYAADLANTRYSPLDQINATNFNDLEVAWRPKSDAFGPHPEYQLESTPC